MAMSAAHKRYREKNPPHKKGTHEKRLDLVISAEAKEALAQKSKAAGITQRQLLETLLLSSREYHTGVMLAPDDIPQAATDDVTPSTDNSITPGLRDKTAVDITPVLEATPTPESSLESIIFKMTEGGFTSGVKSPVPGQIVTELYGGNHSEAAKQVRLMAKKHKGTPLYESLQTLVNRIDGSRPKKPKQKEKEQ